MHKLTNCNFEFVREDDFVEYFIYPKISEADILLPNETNLMHLQQLLQNICDKCNAIVAHNVKELKYIWHKDEFQLQIRTGSAEERYLNDEIKTTTAAGTGQSKTIAEILPPHLHGVTHYGDNNADEWFIVYLLYQITRELNDCIVRVIDADGEFLLIEAAEHLPKWANPDTCEQRVYISAGHLHLVQNSPTNTNKILPVSMAIEKIQQQPSIYRVSKEIEICINERLKEFTTADTINSNLHQQIARVPLGVATILKLRPSLIAPAVRAFCERDTIDMKACRSMRYFPPEQRVRINVHFTRCLYAMIMHNNYLPDRKIGWNLTNITNSEQYKEDLLGIKLACGFEILAAQAKDASATGDDIENEPAWRVYVKSLKTKGYFRDNLEGSEDYKNLLATAKTFYKSNNARFRTAPVVGNEILQLLRLADATSDEQVRDVENNLQPSESDDWLNISAEQLDSMLLARYGSKKLYNANGDINAEEFTKNLSDFLEKQSCYEGIENDSDGVSADDDDDDDDDEDDDVGVVNATNTKKSSQAAAAAAAIDSDDDDDDGDITITTTTTTNAAANISNATTNADTKQRFKTDFKKKVKKNRSMRRACSQENSLINAKPTKIDTSTKTAAAAAVVTKTTTTTTTTTPADDNSFNTHLRNFLDFVIPEDNWDSNSEMSDYEDEDDLEQNIENMTNTEYNIDADIQAYMSQMDKELAKTTIGQTFAQQKSVDKKNTSSKKLTDDDFDDIETFEPININVNTLKNIVDSYKSQLGGVGPVTNLFNAMGIGMSAAAAAEVDSDDNLKESAV